MGEVLERDATLSPWRGSAEAAGAAQVVALLLMTLEERKTLGVALEGDALRHDAVQTTVSLSKHRLVDPAGAEAETRRLLKRRAFDHLLMLALERGELQRERDLLRRKQAALVGGRWGFEAAGETPADPRALQQQLEAIESRLNALGSGAGLLQGQLDIVTEVLIGAEHSLWTMRESLIIDRMGVKQARATDLAPQVDLTVLHNALGQRLIARLVRVSREVLPAQRDLLREAERYLG
jgi:hypothetical protein